jgi:predicted secreted protein
MNKHAFTLAAIATTVTAAASAQMLPPPSNVVSLNASASVEVTKDWFGVTFSTTKEGNDAGAVQAQLKQALDAALAEARKSARPGQVEVQTGGFSLYPRYGQPTPRGSMVINGWQGSAELIVQGRDAQAISQLTSRINTMTIARVGWSLSREAREKVEADVQAEAIGRFRARADAVSKQFGFAGYSLREVAVSSDGAGAIQQPMLRMQAGMAGAQADGLPVEAGKATVTATVSGSVQLHIK